MSHSLKISAHQCWLVQAGRAPQVQPPATSRPAYGTGSSSQPVQLSQSIAQLAAQPQQQQAAPAVTEIDLCAELLSSEAADDQPMPAARPPAKRAAALQSPARGAGGHTGKKQQRRFKPLCGHDEAMLVTPGATRANVGIPSPEQPQGIAAAHVRVCARTVSPSILVNETVGAYYIPWPHATEASLHQLT